jgi:cell division protein FtsB
MYDISTQKIRLYRNPNKRSKSAKNQQTLAYCDTTARHIRRKFGLHGDKPTNDVCNITTSMAVAAEDVLQAPASSLMDIPDEDILQPVPSAVVCEKKDDATKTHSSKKQAPSASARAVKATYPQPTKRNYDDGKFSSMASETFEFVRPQMNMIQSEEVVTYLQRNNITIADPANMTTLIEPLMKDRNYEPTKIHLSQLDRLSKFGLSQINRDMANLKKENTTLKKTLAYVNEEYCKVVSEIFSGRISQVRQHDLSSTKKQLENVQRELRKMKEENKLLKNENELMRQIKPL